MTQKPDIHVEWGHADGYWDVIFDKSTSRDAGLSGTSGISVAIDPRFGGVRLNPGYGEGTDQANAERYLFQRHKAAVVDSLFQALDRDTQPFHDAFRKACTIRRDNGTSEARSNSAWFQVEVAVSDVPKLAGLANENFPDETRDRVEDAVRDALMSPRVVPAQAGYEITKAYAYQMRARVYRLVVHADVFDQDALLTAATASHEASGKGTTEFTDLGQALYEEIVGSNANPSPASSGFEILERRHDGPEVAQAPAPGR